MMRFSKPLITRYSPLEVGGADRDRTDDLRLAKPALSQLSYSPGQLTSLEKSSYKVYATRSMTDHRPQFQSHAGHYCDEDGTED